MSEPIPQVNKEQAKARFDTALLDHSQEFETFFLARLLGLEFSYLPDDAPDKDKDLCRITFPAEELFFNPQGVLHGGAVATVMDISMGHLVNKVAGPGATVEMKVQFIRPVPKGQVTVEGRFLRKGRNLSFMESRLFDEDQKLSAVATATWKMPTT